MIACLDIQKENESIVLECSYIPVHTAKSYQGQKFVVLPIRKDTDDERDKKRLVIIENTLGKEIALKQLGINLCMQMLTGIYVLPD